MTEPERLLTVREIARGGLGFVELVVRREGRFERVYAVKRPHSHLLSDSKMVESFIEEGRVAGLLRHPNVVPVLDVGEDERGPYLLMDFVEGLSLLSLIQHVSREGDLLPASVVVQIAAQAAEGLRAAHELVAIDGSPSPLVHRDVSPQNLLIGYDGIVRVVDFGIAKVLTSDNETTTAVLKGKYGYMAPEQLRFEHIDGRADLFALGVTLFEALSGARLYKGGGIENVARKILHDPPPDLNEHRGDAPPELEHLMIDLLAKDREHRVPSAGVLIDRLQPIAARLREARDWVDLSEFLSEQLGERRDRERAARRRAIEQARAASTTHITRRRRRRGARVMLAGAAVVLLVGAIAWFVGQSSRRATPTESQARDGSPLESQAQAQEPAQEPLQEPLQVQEQEQEQEEQGQQVRAASVRSRMRARMRPRRTMTEMAASTMGLESEFWD